MAEEKKEEVVQASQARTPDYKGDGVAVWINKDKNGKEYLAIKILGSITVAAFKYDNKHILAPV